MSDPSQGAPDPGRTMFERLIGEMRPKLHRYCARMTGSAIDGEDIVQEALLKAIAAYGATDSIARLEAWLFRIAHNTALDFLRQRARQAAREAPEELEMIADPVDAAAAREIAAISLKTFQRLPVTQRSSVILMDVLGYTIEEIATLTESTVPAVKASLHRGRAALRVLAKTPADTAPLPLAAAERARLESYVARFNARDFDAVRDMLAEEVRLDLVARLQLKGKAAVGNYFTQYARGRDWLFGLGTVDGTPAILVRDAEEPQGPPKYAVVLGWANDKVAAIRDFRFARYVLDAADIVSFG
jgi:RNA polymerase sigma-70 factor, ECF subfamily